jgi:hypothetical protein
MFFSTLLALLLCVPMYIFEWNKCKKIHKKKVVILVRKKRAKVVFLVILWVPGLEEDFIMHISGTDHGAHAST